MNPHDALRHHVSGAIERGEAVPIVEQTRIADDGSIELGPLTWDGEPLYSPDTVREGLFSTEPFHQMPGQTNWKLVVCACCRQDFYTYPDKPEPYCPTCMGK